MAFTHHFPAGNWDDSETRGAIETCDIEASWKKRGLGYFAVGGCASRLDQNINDDNFAQQEHSGAVTVRGDDFEQPAGPNNERLDDLKWVGYAGVRDATTTSIPSDVSQNTVLPPWREMVELRYGISSQF